MPVQPKTKIAVLISGRGSNMAAIAEAIRSGEIPRAKIAVVISDQPKAVGLDFAARNGLEAVDIPRGNRSRDDHEREIIARLRKHRVDLICLAGYMRVLSAKFVELYKNRILNIHPSLLPAFPGLDPQKRAIEHGVKWTGCTVHLVDTTVDGGPIIAQRVIPVLDDDTHATLAARLLEEEHQLYVEALKLIVSGNYEVVGRRVLRKN